MLRYYAQWHHLAIADAPSFNALAKIGANLLHSIAREMQPKQGIAFLSGPMSTGGFGNPEENMHFFRAAVAATDEWSQAQHRDACPLVFDQTHFQTGIIKLMQHKPLDMNDPAKQGQGYDMRILEQMYLPWFESKLIRTLYFLPDWQSSFGARWEREQAIRLGMNIVEFPPYILKHTHKILAQHQADTDCTCRMCEHVCFKPETIAA